MSQPQLFTPITLRNVTAKNRIVISPMCQYSAEDGVANDWHLVHLGKFAQGGAGIVMTEAVAVVAEGRITHGDLGLWNDSQVAPLKRITSFIRANGADPRDSARPRRAQGQHAAAVVRQCRADGRGSRAGRSAVDRSSRPAPFRWMMAG